MDAHREEEGAALSNIRSAATRLAAYSEVVKAAMDAEPRGAPPCAMTGPAREALFPSAAGRILGALCVSTKN
jgi:hypothetical protein